jgi:C_GCAxxG_C_C family probable redox protein
LRISRIDDAVACFNCGFSCSQAVFSTYAEQLGLDKQTALKISGTFGGGMAAMGDTCGAVTGAFMVIGLKYGKSKPDDEEAKQRSYGSCKEFVAKFNARHGSIVCRELAGCDISTPEGKREFDEKRVGSTLCPKLVHDAAEILEAVL